MEQQTTKKWISGKKVKENTSNSLRCERTTTAIERKWSWTEQKKMYQKKKCESTPSDFFTALAPHTNPGQYSNSSPTPTPQTWPQSPTVLSSRLDSTLALQGQRLVHAASWRIFVATNRYRSCRPSRHHGSDEKFWSSAQIYLVHMIYSCCNQMACSGLHVARKVEYAEETS